EFEDFLITLDREIKIDLAKFSLFSFDPKSKIFEKLWKELIPKTDDKSLVKTIPPEIYLANHRESGIFGFKTELSEVSSKQLNQSPIQFYVVVLNQKSPERIRDLIAKDCLNSSKIISLNILGFNLDEDELRAEGEAINKKQLLSEVVELFPNLKHLRINQDYFKISDIDQSILERKLAIEFQDYGSSLISSVTPKRMVALGPRGYGDGLSASGTIRQYGRGRSDVSVLSGQKSSEDDLWIGDKNQKNSASKSENSSFNMVKAGKKIHRPESKRNAMLIRDSCNILELGNQLLSDDWLPSDKDKSTEIALPQTLSKSDFNQFLPKEHQKQTHSFCSFTIDLKANQKNKLLSISPDNDIVGYYCDPRDDNIKFFKDDAGFFYVESSKSCTIKYILKGQEPEYKTLKDDLDDLQDPVKQIIDKYLGVDKSSFPLLITQEQYAIPSYNFSTSSGQDLEKYNKQWLDQLFDIKNKGNCRHRVMALAKKFTDANLKYNHDFRIIGINNDHILFEVKNKRGDWITLDLGGAQSQLNYQFGQNYQVSSAEDNEEKSISIPCDLPSSSPSLHEKKPRNLVSVGKSESDIAQDDLEFKILQEKILGFYQLTSSKDIASLKELLTTFFSNSENKSLLLTTNHFQELKNYLLSLKNNSHLKVIDQQRIDKIYSDLSFHVIESVQALVMVKDSIKITDPNPVITEQTPLAEFIAMAKQQPQKTHLLIIDWQKFDDKHRVASNTIFDHSKRTIDGVEIPDNMKIICIDEAKSRSFDPAVLSRFNIASDLSLISKKDLLGIDQDEGLKFLESGSTEIELIIEFDGEGMDNWQQKLFGRIVVNGQSLEWQKSQFIIDLEDLVSDSQDNQENKIAFQFKNFSKNQQEQILKLFNQAKIQGFINYYGHLIKFPKNFSVIFEQLEFDFQGILQSFSDQKDSPLVVDLLSVRVSPSQSITLKIFKNIQTLEAISDQKNLVVINSQLFDQLLVKKSIEDSGYWEKKGIIEEHENQTLKLVITEQLTTAQLYCLMFNAKKHRVSLELYFAKNVKIDDQIFSRFYQSSIPEIADSSQSHSENCSISSHSRIIVCNDVEKTFSELKQKITISHDLSSKTINIVNIEDVLFSDLFDEVKYQIADSSNGKYFAFEKLTSEVVAKLNAGEIVVLKGKFPNALLSSLHEQILDLKTQYPNLYFIIEEDILRSSKESSQLTWLDKARYSILYHHKEQDQEAVIEKERYASVEGAISEDSKQQAQDFITNRKEIIRKLLTSNSALQIIGHSGVGKSSLFGEIKRTGFEQSQDVSVFEELENIEKWASDSVDRIKILVIDEFNVDGSTNFTMFRDFVNAQDDLQRKIFYKGKFYQLSDKHKIVFLGNPHNYGNRYKHKLFLDCQIPKLQLQDFSQSYIYENILKEPIYDRLGQRIKVKITELQFKKIAVEAIRKYYENNQKKADSESDLPKETVRELQERVLQEIVKQTQANITKEIANDNFISTQVNLETITQLQTAIKIRQLQKLGDFPAECLGTNGVIFEGDSGIGKSVMIEAVLQNQGINKITSLDSAGSSDSVLSLLGPKLSEQQSQHFYYKIDASLSYQEIKEKLIKAFELGVIVVIDELNTRIDEGLEKDINALLTGQHPIDSSIKMKPGFMIITSVNKAISAGRANFSPAIKHRCSIISGLPLRDYQVEDFTKIIVNWFEKSQLTTDSNFNLKLVKKIAKDLQQLVAQNPEVNLRALKTKFNEVKDEMLKTKHDYRLTDQLSDPIAQITKIESSNVYFFSFQDHLNYPRDTSPNQEKFSFRFKGNYEKPDPKNDIFEALKEAQNNLAISDDDMIKFIILANKHQGLFNVFNSQNKDKIEEDFKRIFKENWQEKKSQSIRFSANFQQILHSKDILTGRSKDYREVGMRLKRLDPELLQEFLLKDIKIPLKKEFIKDNFLNKFNEIMGVSPDNIKDSIRSLEATQALR
ncbi:MAG: hypothetical protein RL769_197, partial [Pseudomonadota bacterium]